MNSLKKNAILACMDKKGKVNLITIGWKTIGVLWSRPVITVAIHPNRFSYSVLEKGEQAFTVNLGGSRLKEVTGFLRKTFGKRYR